MALVDTLLTIFILLSLLMLVYLRMTNKTLKDLALEIREISQQQTTEVIDI